MKLIFTTTVSDNHTYNARKLNSTIQIFFLNMLYLFRDILYFYVYFFAVFLWTLTTESKYKMMITSREQKHREQKTIVWRGIDDVIDMYVFRALVCSSTIIHRETNETVPGEGIESSDI